MTTTTTIAFRAMARAAVDRVYADVKRLRGTATPDPTGMANQACLLAEARAAETVWTMVEEIAERHPVDVAVMAVMNHALLKGARDLRSDVDRAEARGAARAASEVYQAARAYL